MNREKKTHTHSKYQKAKNVCDQTDAPAEYFRINALVNIYEIQNGRRDKKKFVVKRFMIALAIPNDVL